jgi:molybdopterin-guanine dinucleotide biosynthesis protein A
MQPDPGANDVIGLIPAGGKSSRFGSNKALYRMGGATLVERVHAALSAVLHDVRLGLARPGDVPPLVGVPCVYDDPDDSGASASLRAAFSATDASWILIAACDMPGLTPDAVTRLLEARRDDLDVVVALGEDGAMHPLFACYRRTCLETLDQNAAGRTRSMRRLVDSLRKAEVRFENRIVWNVNRLEDLADPGTDPPGASSSQAPGRGSSDQEIRDRLST